MFLRLHYTSPPGRAFLINVNVISGVEINGTTEDQGSLLTLTYPGKDGEPKYECVCERFGEIERRLHNAGLMANEYRGKPARTSCRECADEIDELDWSFDQIADFILKKVRDAQAT